MKHLKKGIALIMTAVMAVSFTGCSKESSSDTISSITDQASKLLAAEGREYDKLYTAGMNETLTNSFFDFTVKGAEKTSEVDGYAPQTEGYQFLVVDIEVKNVFDDAIPVGNYDFYVIWNGGEDVPYLAFTDDMYPDDVELAKGETLSGKLVFEVPADAEDIMVAYDEIWDDDFKGNTYAISIELQ